MYLHNVAGKNRTFIKNVNHQRPLQQQSHTRRWNVAYKNSYNAVLCTRVIPAIGHTTALRNLMKHNPFLRFSAGSACKSGLRWFGVRNLSALMVCRNSQSTSANNYCSSDDYGPILAGGVAVERSECISAGCEVIVVISTWSTNGRPRDRRQKCAPSTRSEVHGQVRPDWIWEREMRTGPVYSVILQSCNSITTANELWP